MYRTLNRERIITTLVTLGNRIRERFPEASLAKVSAELLEIARESGPRLRRLKRPRWVLRLAMLLVIAGMAALAVVVGMAISAAVRLKIEEAMAPTDFIQGIDAAVNEIILLGLALVFLLSVEGRLKRREALGALHELRSIAHVIDMHQLTKDPEALVSKAQPTPSSPTRSMTRFELSRYLDYSVELLSLTSKLAALYAQHLPDAVVLGAVNDVEELAGGLSQKIWQKIMLLDTGMVSERAGAAESRLAREAAGATIVEEPLSE